MANRMVKPVRAWAYYDAWMWMQDLAGDFPRLYAIPLTGVGEEFVSGPKGVVAAVRGMETLAGREMGPLRSLRILYENGYELKVKGREGTIQGTSDYGTTWDWSLWMPLAPGSVYAMPGPIARGSFPEDKDHEAVERAMIGAVAWFTQVDAATLGTDSL
jgi:hypothetical protein